MRWLLGILVGGLLGVGCGKTVYRSHEGHYCSSTEDDDPFFECSPSYDLVCINTYAEQILQTGGLPPRYQEIFLCRLACQPGDRCPDLKDVCCPGPIYGRSYDRMHACVPAGMCQTVSTTDAGTDARRDAQASQTDSATPDGPDPDGPMPDGPNPDLATVDQSAGADASDGGATDGAGP